jgi:hypothetical protein
MPAVRTNLPSEPLKWSLLKASQEFRIDRVALSSQSA